MATTDRVRPTALLAIAATAVAGGALLGAVTNSINGWVSPTYFRTILGWHDVQQVWLATVAQGVFEGLIYGSLAALVLVIVVGVATGGRLRFSQVRGRLCGILLGVVACWLLGGVLALGLASLSPEFYQRAFRGVPHEFGPMLRYAWVGGSIWGAMIGALLSLAIGSVLITSDLRQASDQAD